MMIRLLESPAENEGNCSFELNTLRKAMQNANPGFGPSLLALAVNYSVEVYILGYFSLYLSLSIIPDKALNKDLS